MCLCFTNCIKTNVYNAMYTLTQTMKDSQCIRGFVPQFDSAEQTVTIELKGLYVSVAIVCLQIVGRLNHTACYFLDALQLTTLL